MKLILNSAPFQWVNRRTQTQNPATVQSVYQVSQFETPPSSKDAKVHSSGNHFHRFTYLHFRPRASAEESCRRIKLLNESEEMFGASPHGERHLGT